MEKGKAKENPEGDQETQWIEPGEGADMDAGDFRDGSVGSDRWEGEPAVVEMYRSPRGSNNIESLGGWHLDAESLTGPNVLPPSQRFSRGSKPPSITRQTASPHHSSYNNHEPHYNASFHPPGSPSASPTMPQTRFAEIISSTHSQINANGTSLEEPPLVKDLPTITEEIPTETISPIRSRYPTRTYIPARVIPIEKDKSVKGVRKTSIGKGKRSGKIMSTNGSEQSPFERAFAAAVPPLPSPSTSGGRGLARGVYGNNGSAVLLDGGAAGWTTGQGTPVRIEESGGVALEKARHAMYGIHRLAEGRFVWILPPEHDPRVVWLLDWVKQNSWALASVGLHKFLSTRERGAFFTNVEYRADKYPDLPTFDWMGFSEAQLTRDRTLQQSIAANNPSTTCLVFVFLVSKSGNSIGIWRRKLPIPEALQESYRPQIDAVKSTLSNKVYLVKLNTAVSSPVAKSPPVIKERVIVPKSPTITSKPPTVQDDTAMPLLPEVEARPVVVEVVQEVEVKKKKKRNFFLRWITWGSSDKKPKEPKPPKESKKSKKSKRK